MEGDNYRALSDIIERFIAFYRTDQARIIAISRFLSGGSLFRRSSRWETKSMNACMKMFRRNRLISHGLGWILQCFRAFLTFKWLISHDLRRNSENIFLGELSTTDGYK